MSKTVRIGMILILCILSAALAASAVLLLSESTGGERKPAEEPGAVTETEYGGTAGPGTRPDRAPATEPAAGPDTGTESETGKGTGTGGGTTGEETDRDTEKETEKETEKVTEKVTEKREKDPEKPLTGAVADRIGGGENSHRLVLTGGAGTKSVKAVTGTRSDSYTVWQFPAKGSAAEWVFDLSAPVPADREEPILLAVKEIHRETEDTFAYSVLVDGTPVYFRTYTEIASAPNVYYIWIRRGDIKDLSSVGIRIVSEDKTPFAIASVTAYTDLFGAFRREGNDTKMGIYLHSAASLDKAKQHISDFAGYTYDLYDLGLLFKLDYMNSSLSSAYNQLVEFTDFAADNKMDLQIMPTLYWGSPYVADGIGGFFTDAKYQQVAYNSRDGKYYGTNPNVYSSTTWVTTGSDLLIRASTEKIRSVFTDYAGFLNSYRNTSGYEGKVSIVMEHGVCYKGANTSTGVAFNAMDCGDFHPGIIAAAKADGVRLDPTDGLSREEKLWMIKHHADYNEALAKAYTDAFGTGALLLDGKKVTYPTELVSDNLYTHGVQWTERSPANSDKLVSGWKSGVGYYMYSSSEDMYWDDVRFYQYKAAYGKVGTVNFEISYSRGNDLYDLARKAYETGFEFLTLFNDATDYGTASILKQLDNIDEETATYTVNHYDRMLLNADYNRDTAVPDVEKAYGIVQSKGVSYDRVNGVLKADQGDGYVIYKITDGGDAFPAGLRFETESTGNGITVYGGGSLSDMKEIGKLKISGGKNYVNSFSVTEKDISAQTAGLTEYYLKLVFSGNASLKTVKVYRIYDQTSGQCNGISYNREQARILSLTTQNAAVLDAMMLRYEKTDGADAKKLQKAEALADAGLYSGAYGALTEMLASSLPVTAIIKGENSIPGYPVTMKTTGTFAAQITLHSCSKTGAVVSFFSTYSLNEKARTVTVTFGDLKEGSYSFTSIGYNRYELKADEKGSYHTEKGKVTVTVQIAFGGVSGTYSTVSGRFVSSDGAYAYLTVQDPSVSGWSKSTAFALNKNATYTRHADGSTESSGGKPSKGDYVILTFDEKGREVIAVEAVYGEVTGKIIGYTAPDYSDANTHNACVTLDNGVTYELDYLDGSTLIVNGAENANARTFTDAALSSLLKGKNVTLRYCPEYYGIYQRVLSVQVLQ